MEGESSRGVGIYKDYRGISGLGGSALAFMEKKHVMNSKDYQTPYKEGISDGSILGIFLVRSSSNVMNLYSITYKILSLMLLQMPRLPPTPRNEIAKLVLHGLDAELDEMKTPVSML